MSAGLRAIQAHLKRCVVCVELQRLAIRRRDRALIEVAIRLRAQHVANDAEREAHASAVRVVIPTRTSTRCARKKR
jgi:hypothetical protein